MSEYEPKREHPHSFVWPIIFIAVGVIFLLSNLGLLGDDVWSMIWRLWPLFFIAIGLDSLFRRKEIVGPVFMIGLGCVFLLSSLGLLGWGAWDVLWRLWPLLLVAVGLEIIVGRRSVWVSLLSVMLIFAVLVGAIWLSGLGPRGGERLMSETISQTLDADIAQAKIYIAPALGELDLFPLTDSDNLIAGDASVSKGRPVWSDYSVSGDTAKFSVEVRSVTIYPNNLGWDWDFGLTPLIPLELDVSMGAGDMRLDLAGLTVSGLDISQGVGEITVLLPFQDSYRADISQAIGSIVVVVPDDIGVRLEVSRAISAFSLPSDFEHRGDYYYSPGYDNAEDRADLEISQAIGNIEVRYEK